MISLGKHYFKIALLLRESIFLSSFLNNSEIWYKKSIFSWKNIVKKKSKEFELRKLLNMKEYKSKSKVKNLNYDKLHIQDYLINLDVKLAKNVFRYRTRMIQFDGKFNGLEPINVCSVIVGKKCN